MCCRRGTAKLPSRSSINPTPTSTPRKSECTAQMDADDTRTAVAAALFYPYVMRITAHLMNVPTAMVMPSERLDYWDEDKIDWEIDG